MRTWQPSSAGVILTPQGTTRWGGRGGLTTLLILFTVFSLQAACEGQDNSSLGGSSTAREERAVQPLTEAILRIEGMT